MSWSTRANCKYQVVRTADCCKHFPLRSESAARLGVILLEIINFAPVLSDLAGLLPSLEQELSRAGNASSMGF